MEIRKHHKPGPTPSLLHQGQLNIGQHITDPTRGAISQGAPTWPQISPASLWPPRQLSGNELLSSSSTPDLTQWVGSGSGPRMGLLSLLSPGGAEPLELLPWWPAGILCSGLLEPPRLPALRLPEAPTSAYNFPEKRERSWLLPPYPPEYLWNACCLAHPMPPTHTLPGSPQPLSLQVGSERDAS